MPVDYENSLFYNSPEKCQRCGTIITDDAASPYCEDCRDKRRENRLALLRGWYDPKKPGVLMRRDKPEIFVEALNFFVDVYYKKWEQLSHLYFMPDCKHKRTMQEMFTRPRSALVAPRESSKTFTVVFEMCPFIAITRPRTPILIGSETKDLTVEKLKAIRKRVERNPGIYSDFGQVWPLSRADSFDWNNKCLDFINGSCIQGSSIDQATRGRHPMVGILDDPEGKRSKNQTWRDSFMEYLFRDYINQFRDKGTHVMWVGTLLDVDSCLWRAVHNEDPENRFVAWKREILKMIYDEDGQQVSAWPEKLTVDEFQRKLKGREDETGEITPIGLQAAMAEFQGEPMPSGSRMFVREERKHGYVLAVDDKGDRYFYDMATGKSRSFEIMSKECHILMGVDIADTETSDADPSGIVVIMVDHRGVMWTVDAWTRRCFSDVTASMAMRLCHDWKVGRCGWEAVALGKRIYREVYVLRQQRLKAGFHVPQLIALTTEGIPKPLRIERMRPDFDAGLIKFPSFHEVDGHKPWEHPNKAAIRELIQQFDKMTDETKKGVDMADAFEMARRIADNRPKKYIHRTEGQAQLEDWEHHGVLVEPGMVDPRHWTDRQRELFKQRTAPFGASDKMGGAADAFD